MNKLLTWDRNMCGGVKYVCEVEVGKALIRQNDVVFNTTNINTNETTCRSTSIITYEKSLNILNFNEKSKVLCNAKYQNQKFLRP